MKRLLNISERNSKRILSIICLVLALFVPGCIPFEDVTDAAFGQGCQFQRPTRNSICFVTYRTRGGQQKDVFILGCTDPFDLDCTGPKPIPVDDCVEVIRITCGK